MSGQRPSVAATASARERSLPVTLTVPMAGAMLGLSRSASYMAADRGDIPTIRMCGRLHVPTVAFLDLVGWGHDAVAVPGATTAADSVDAARYPQSRAS
jgi:hypothetical protein